MLKYSITTLVLLNVLASGCTTTSSLYKAATQHDVVHMPLGPAPTTLSMDADPSGEKDLISAMQSFQHSGIRSLEFT